MIEICTVGGYDEVGKNMTAVNVNGRVIVLDMGLYMSKFIEQQGKGDVHGMSARQLIKVGCIPNDGVIKDWWRKVDAIVPTHAHLDHVGGVPFLADKYDAPIVATPFTLEVLERQLEDNRVKLSNEFKELNPNSRFKIAKGLEIEFIHMTHSTPQVVTVAIHTKEGIILYANDFKFDSTPILGKKPNFKRLRELGKSGKVLVLIADSTRAQENQKTPSEGVAKALLEDVLLGTESKGKAVIVTTFASHLARQKTIIQLAKKMGREVVFVGRSLAKYIGAGEAVGIVNFSEEARILRFGKQARRFFSMIERKKSWAKYLIVVTGHQGEPNAVLSRLARDEFDFRLKKEDHVIFSCTVIPAPVNKHNRKVLERLLKKKKVRIFTDLHVSGHAAREDLRDLINMTKPKYIIPAHGPRQFRRNLLSLAREMGYPRNRVLMVQNGKRTVLK